MERKYLLSRPGEKRQDDGVSIGVPGKFATSETRQPQITRRLVNECRQLWVLRTTGSFCHGNHSLSQPGRGRCRRRGVLCSPPILPRFVAEDACGMRGRDPRETRWRRHIGQYRQSRLQALPNLHLRASCRSGGAGPIELTDHYRGILCRGKINDFDAAAGA